MLLSQVLENTWTLSLDGMTYIAHTPQAPFAVALRREKTYESDRGTVKEHVVEAERVSLTDVEETAEGVVLSGGGHTLQVQVVPCDGGAEDRFGEVGKLPYLKEALGLNAAHAAAVVREAVQHR